MSRSKKSRNNCRRICIISIAIAYLYAYTSLSRISKYIDPFEDVSYDQHNKSLHEIYFSEIRSEASSLAREYTIVRSEHEHVFISEYSEDILTKID